MRDLVMLLVHVIATVAKLLLPSGARSVVAESLLLKHQLNPSTDPPRPRLDQCFHLGVSGHSTFRHAHGETALRGVSLYFACMSCKVVVQILATDAQDTTDSIDTGIPPGCSRPASTRAILQRRRRATRPGSPDSSTIRCTRKSRAVCSGPPPACRQSGCGRTGPAEKPADADPANSPWIAGLARGRLRPGCV